MGVAQADPTTWPLAKKLQYVRQRLQSQPRLGPKAGLSLWPLTVEESLRVIFAAGPFTPPPPPTADQKAQQEWRRGEAELRKLRAYLREKG